MACIDLNYDKDNNAINMKQRKELLPNYLNSLVHLNKKKAEEFFKFMGLLSQTGANSAALKSEVEASHSVELATCFAQRGDWSRVRVYTEKAFLQFGDTWRSLHPCAVSARKVMIDIYVCIYVYLIIHINMNIHKYEFIYMYMYKHIFMYIHIHMYEKKNTYIYVCIYIYIYIYNIKKS
jgi:hypothetical protein